jgi:poly-beta-1,6-N-acetyl-D-glucosamine synthase
VLITPARNEGAFIKMTLDSVLAQTIPPEHWFIVNNGSINNTAEIVAPFAEQVSWIEIYQSYSRFGH